MSQPSVPSAASPDVDRADSAAAFTGIPVIDIAPFRDGGPQARGQVARGQVARAVAEACERVGFLYIAGHGVPETTIAAAADAARRFFELPAEEKRRVHLGRSPNHRGWMAPREMTNDPAAGADLREAYKVGLELPADDPDVRAASRFYGPNVWPQAPGDFRPAIEAYYAAMLDLARTLFRVFAASLDLPEEHFLPLTAKPLSILNLNYYPVDPAAPKTASGTGAHTDPECFAVLWQDAVGGLQIQNQAGAWIAAPPIPGTFVINIGDVLARWTNDRFRSTRHRVVNPSGRARQSMAFFGNCGYHTRIACLDTCLAPGAMPKYPPIVLGEHFEAMVRKVFHYARAMPEIP